MMIYITSHDFNYKEKHVKHILILKLEQINNPCINVKLGRLPNGFICWFVCEPSCVACDW